VKVAEAGGLVAWGFSVPLLLLVFPLYSFQSRFGPY
jgi:hypothetical protein